MSTRPLEEAAAVPVFTRRRQTNGALAPMRPWLAVLISMDGVSAWARSELHRGLALRWDCEYSASLDCLGRDI